jgi:hypothetical protein
MLRTVRRTYLGTAALSLVCCVVLIVLVNRTAPDIVVAVVAVLNAGTVWWAFKGARAGIARNTDSRRSSLPVSGCSRRETRSGLAAREAARPSQAHAQSW